MKLRRIVNNIIKTQKYLYYQCMYERILREKKAKERLKVVFFVMSVDMWKSDELFKLLLNDNRFEPYIIPQLLQNNSLSQNSQRQLSIRKYCEQKGFPYKDAINVKTGEVIDIHQFCPDIVFYSQPYNAGLKRHRIEKLWSNALFAYIPYCLNLELDPIYYTFLYQNICWKYYCAVNLNKEYESTLLYNKGCNMVVVGHPLFEAIEKSRGNETCLWKDKSHNKIRLIWAPHHSILPNDIGYSNFLQLADLMQDYARKHVNDIEIAFKPHPVLKSKLMNLKEWGEVRTNQYYDFWKDSPNTILVDGPYSDLFMTSDAMIHDSASFTCEYLYTGKPVMFITNNAEEHKKGLNNLGKACFDLHYLGSNIEDINKFVNEVVIKGEDDMLHQREVFVRSELIQQGATSVLIYNDIKKTLQ